MSRTRDINSSSVSFANSGPVIILASVSWSVHKPICLAISMAVPIVSPVTILTRIPALTQSSTAIGTSSRTGSLIATTPMNVKFLATTLLSTITSSLFSTIWYANPNVRIACCW